jgi:hypothetical protein
MSYREQLEQVEAMIAEGVPFEQIEQRIEEHRDLPSEAKSALWLYAWAEQPRATRRAVVESLAMVER